MSKSPKKQPQSYDLTSYFSFCAKNNLLNKSYYLQSVN